MTNTSTSHRGFWILGISLIIGLALFGVQVGRAVKVGRAFDRFLSVRGLSEREVKATLVIWPIRFSVIAEDLASLRTEMESSRIKVSAYLTESGISSNEIAHGLPTVIDREDQRLQDNRPGMARYRGFVTLVVRSTNVDLAKKALQGADILLQRDVAYLGSDGGMVEFVFNGLSEIKPDMIREATANARAAAEKFAQDSNSKVGAIRKATQGMVEIEDRDAASPELKRVRVVTTVEFFLE